RLAESAVRGRYGEAAALLGVQAPGESRGGVRGEQRHRARLLEQLHQPLRGSALPAPVPVHSVDGDQPRRLLRRAQGPLLDSRDLQSRRYVRTLELAWPARLRG